LAPTTSFWKTDIILTQEEKAKFIDEYIAFSGKKTDVKKFYSRVKIYEAMNCLRGVSWCAMAWVEYQNPKKLIRNQFTYQKIQSYLSEEFLMAIENQYFAL
ncbi:MAG: aminoglycoside phosphotransferase, partial [Oscillospiraceae bacterium]